jgi:hypothetical protein
MSNPLSYYTDRVTHQPVALEIWLRTGGTGAIRITHPPLPEFNHATLYSKYGVRRWLRLTPEDNDIVEKLYRESGIEAARDYLLSSLILYLMFEKKSN